MLELDARTMLHAKPFCREKTINKIRQASAFACARVHPRNLIEITGGVAK